MTPTANAAQHRRRGGTDRPDCTPAIDSRVPAALIPGARLHVETAAGHPPHDGGRATQRTTSFLR